MPRVVVCVPFMISLVAISGCGEKGVATYQVSGTVMVDGRPADGARVIFCPKDSSDEEIMRLRPFGVTDASGQFGLTTFIKGDGAPAGEYGVIVRWQPQSAEELEDRDRAPRVKDRLKGKYGDPNTSGISATVEDGDTTLPPFELSAK